MIVVNFFGGPGTGKSTMAAAIFAELKFSGVNCECVQEYVKDKVWEGSYGVLDDQLYIFGKQQHRLKRLDNKVDIALIDSPIILSVIYDPDKDKTLREFVLKKFNEYENINIFLKREKNYNPAGRIHTFEEAKEKDIEIEKLLIIENIPYATYISNKESVKPITEIIQCAINQ